MDRYDNYYLLPLTEKEILKYEKRIAIFQNLEYTEKNLLLPFSPRRKGVLYENAYGHCSQRRCPSFNQ